MDLSALSIGEGVRRRLEASLSHLSHAYIISGPPGTAVNALAEKLAAAYVCSGTGDRPCGRCSGCRKAAGHIHPDIVRVTLLEGKREISVEQVRRLRADAYIRPNEAARKVFLIDPAQAMNDSAQNALLKVLEDGPDYLAFLLLTEQPGQLLPTIRSRCETLSLAPRPEEDTGQQNGELQQLADEWVKRLLAGDELALMEHTVALETAKWDADSLSALLEAVEAALCQALPQSPRQVLPVLERLKQIRRAATFHVGTGHLLGWLAADRSM